MPDTQISEEMVDAFIATFNSGVFDKAPFGMPIDERCRCKKCLQEEADARSTVRASLEAALSGHVVVPREPTWEMQIAGRDAIEFDGDDDASLSTDDASDCYRAMIQAAPPVPVERG